MYKDTYNSLHIASKTQRIPISVTTSCWTQNSSGRGAFKIMVDFLPLPTELLVTEQVVIRKSLLRGV